MARKARDYKAEYQRRKRNALARGKTLAEARGHKDESRERKARRLRIRQQFGVSPERLSRLRREAAAAVETKLREAGARVNAETVAAGVKFLDAEMLAVTAQLGAADLRRLASLSYEALILEYPELENTDERNPYWYR